MTHKNIPLSAPHIDGNEWQYVKECLDTGWVSSSGPFVERFEKAVSKYVGAENAVAVMNGTAALHIALLVVGVRPGDEVLVSDLTFVAPANAIRYAGAHPVFMDADPKTWQMDPSKVERFLTEECELRGEECFNKKTGRRVAVLLPVHILGLACEMDKIMTLAKRFRLKVVEDTAEAMGVRFKGRHVGTFGDAAAFSFNGNKVVTAGGGGMVVTNNKKYADYARYLTTQAKDDPREYFHHEIGYNYRLTSLQAAVGLAQMEQLDHFIVRKKEIASFYRETLVDSVEAMEVPLPADGCDPTYWLFTLLLKEGTTLEQRKEVIRNLNQAGIGARSLWHTLHDLPPYRGALAYRIEHSIDLYQRGICLPSSVNIQSADLRKVVDVFQKIVP